ncbi:MAG: hypothetical protein HY814_05510 [Candidatus Riflebacteria bacterium]|nr:hypothetical protein [Candidatus Riflebacteria bacterium]
MPDAFAFAKRHQVLLLRHDPLGTPVDLSLAWLPYEREAIARATPVEMSETSVPTASPQDLIIYKAVAWRIQDQRDIEKLLLLHGRSIDLVNIRTRVREFAELLEAPERVGEFDALVKRALGETGTPARGRIRRPSAPGMPRPSRKRP